MNGCSRQIEEATLNCETQTLRCQRLDRPVVFLVGPPGSGKSALGRRLSAEARFRFIDLIDDGTTDAALKQIIESKCDGIVRIVALPWSPTRDAAWLKLCRRNGWTVALWAHPLDMQKRSGRPEPLFTPVGRLRTHDGFGRTGTGCREYRRLARACEHVLFLGQSSEKAAAQGLKSLIDDLQKQEMLSPAEREGLLGWAQNWITDFHADPKACEILIDAMACFTLSLKAQGATPRRMSAVYQDLNAAGFLVMCCDAPKGNDVLNSFRREPSDYEFSRKISDSPHSLARYSSTRKAFSTYLCDFRKSLDCRSGR